MGSARTNSSPELTPPSLPTDPALYERAFTHAFEGMALSSGGKILDINEAALRIFGYEREQLVGTPLAELVAPESRDAVIRAIEAERTARYELRFQRSDGTLFEAEAQAKVIPHGGRKVRMTILRDISERRRSAASLRDYQAKLNRAMRVARLGHWELDLATERFFFDDNCLQLLGTNAATEGGHEMAVADFTRRFMPPDKAEIIDQEIQSIRHAGSPSYERQLELPFLRTDGSTGIMLAHISIICDEAGHPIRAHGVNQDVTDLRAAEEERQRLQDQLLQNQKLEALGTLAGGIAHDFNNILTGILGNLQLAAEDLDSSHPAHESVVDANRAAQRARELVSRILAFGRRRPAQRHAVPLGSIITEVAQLLRASLPPDLHLTVDLSAACPLVECDPAEIHQAVLNLCTNAAQAMPQQRGRIELTLHFAPPDAELRQRCPQIQPEHAIHLAVQDDGAGIDPALLPRVFEPFFTTKPTGEGTGLGLTTVHRIMDNHQGSVTIESAVGRGTRVELHFTPAPATARPRDPSKPPFPIPSGPFGAGRRLLLVEDDQAARTTGQRALERLGFKVIALADPTDALQLFQSRPADFAAVMTDLSMPRLDGIEFASRLRAINPDARILLVSGFLHEASSRDAPTAGIARILSKPYDLAELAAALQAVLSPTA